MSNTNKKMCYRFNVLFDKFYEKKIFIFKFFLLIGEKFSCIFNRIQLCKTYAAPPFIGMS